MIQSLPYHIRRPVRFAASCLLTVVLALGGALGVAPACGPDPGDAPGNGSGFSTNRAPLSSGGFAPVTSFAGVIDPTNPAFAGGMQKCTGSCSGTLTAQNTAAFQLALNAASSQNRTLYVPAGTYPLSRTAGQAYAIDFSGLKDVTIDAQNVTFRQTGDATSTDFAMFWARNTSNVVFFGPTFSQRDVTNATTNTIALKIGDGGTTSVDRVYAENLTFVEGVGGDYVRLDGGTTTTTVQRVTLTNHCRFEHSARAAIDVRNGVQALAISYSFFLGNANRDVWFEGTGGDSPIGQAQVVGNTFDRTGSTTPEALTFDGFGGTNNNDQNLVQENKLREGIITGANLTNTIISENAVTMTTAFTSSPMLSLTGHSRDVWVQDNYFNRSSTATGGVGIKINSDVATSAVWVQRNRVYQYSSIDPAIDVSSTARVIVKANSITYQAATADSGSTGFVGVLCSASAGNACSGSISENNVVRGDQIAIFASLDLATLSLTPNINTVVQAVQGGTYGNSETLRIVADASSSTGSMTETTTCAVTAHVKTGTGGTTILQFETLFNNDVCIRVKTVSTTPSTVLAAGDVFSATHLAGGLQAGRMLAGVQVLKGAGTTTNGLVLRDNVVNGAQKGLWLDADGSAQWPEGYPVIAGNILLSVATDIGGGITTWVTEKTPYAETIATGALSVNKRVTFIAEASTQTYTLADGLVDGQIHYVKIKSFSGVTGTLTPAHMADGTTHTVTWTAAGGFVALMWDATAATYRVVGSSNIVIN